MFPNLTTVASYLLLPLLGLDFNKTITYYETTIAQSVIKSTTYKLDEDASKYKPKNDQIEDFGTFDFIVIGCGTAGSVIASRLSEIKEAKVLALEAGIFGSIVTEIPGLFNIAASSDYNWGYKMESQTYGCKGYINQVCPIIKGRGVGGTSLLNGQIYSRSFPDDFDRIANLTSDDWKYENVLKYFKKSENMTQTNEKTKINWPYHGKGGPLNVQNPSFVSNKVEAFIQANIQLGYNLTDYNSPSGLGVSYMQIMNKFGKRSDTGSSFVIPNLNRDNLDVSTESYVTKIEINSQTKVAESVLFTKNGKLYRATARKEIILSAGAIASPQILMLSGVGRSEELSKFNIPVVSELATGENLRDHLLLPMFVSYFDLEPIVSLKTAVREYLQGAGILTSCGPIDGIAFYDSTGQNAEYPDVEMFVLPNILSMSAIMDLPSILKVFNFKPTTLLEIGTVLKSKFFMLLSNVLDTKSVGSVTLRSDSPYDYPKIDPNILSNKQDVDKIIQLVKIGRRLSETPAFKKYKYKLSPPTLAACIGYEYGSDDYWRCSVEQISFPTYHSVGTCQMGKSSKSGAVVSPELKVFGVEQLRVADASVLPFPPKGHIEPNVVAIGEIVSDMIKKTHGLL